MAGSLIAALMLTLATSGAWMSSAAAAGQLADPAIKGSWQQLGADARRTSYNPREVSLTADTVAGLHVVWSQDTGGPGVNGIMVPPVVSNGVVYVLSSSSFASAFAASDGTLIWGNGGDCGDCIAPAAPAISYGVLLAPISPGHSSTGSSTVTGIGRLGDQVHWTIRANGPWSSSPATLGGTVYEGYPDCCTGSGGVEARDALSGDRLWFSAKGDPSRSVAVGDGLVLSGGYALDVATGVQRWRRVDLTAVTVAHGSVFGFCQGSVCAVDDSTGVDHWRSTAPADHLALAGPVLLASGSGSVQAFDARTGASLWSTDAGAGSISAAGHLVYVSSGTHLLALDISNGALLADVDLGTPITQAVVLGGHVFVGGQDGMLYALST